MPVALPIPAAEKAQAQSFLLAKNRELASLLSQRLPGAQVKLGDTSDKDGKWTQTIEVRQGAKVGVDLEVEFSGGEAIYSADTASKLASALIALFGFGAAAAGGYMGAEHIAPFNFLPSKKWSIALGFVAMLVVGAIVGAIVARLVAGSAHGESKRLVAEVLALVAEQPDAHTVEA